MHARFDELIALRNALRALPPLEPPAGAWERIAASLAQAPARHVTVRASAHWTRGLSLAAVASIALLLVLFPGFLQQGGDAAGSGPPLDLLVSRSQQLEATLHAMPPRPAVERAANSATIDALQARIQWLDAELSGHEAGSERARELWGSRVQLLDSLVAVRYAEAVRAGQANYSRYVPVTRGEL